LGKLNKGRFPKGLKNSLKGNGPPFQILTVPNAQELNRPLGRKKSFPGFGFVKMVIGGSPETFFPLHRLWLSGRSLSWWFPEV